jgi:heme-degrading monooxygenase HmoA
MHARVAVYKLKPHSSDTVIEKAEAGMLPIFRRHKGFHHYEAIKAGHDMVVSISTWDSEGEAAEAVRAAASWVKDNVAEHVLSVENHVGLVAFSHRAT